MNNLEVGIGDSRLCDQVFKNVTVLYLADAQDCMPYLVLVLHCTDSTGHVLELFLVLGLCPLVGAVGKILIVVLSVVVIRIEEVLKVVETNDVALLAVCFAGKRGQYQNNCKGV